MAAIFDTVKLSYSEYYNATKDPEIDSWPLMDNPVPVISILSLYLLIVLKIGPQLMDQRKPYSLRSTLVIYNFAMVLVSIVLTIWPVVTNCINFLYQNGCHPTQEYSKTIYYKAASYTWLFMMSKIIELADTVFFILRKKYNQVSFLHVYHHSSTLFYSWIHLKYLPGLQGIIMGFLNSGVHIIMYFYYMLSAMGPAYQKYLWWKKYITVIQMVQFVLMMTYMTGTLVFSCDLPKIVSIYFNLISIIFLLLFINFYNRSYTKKAV